MCLPHCTGDVRQHPCCFCNPLGTAYEAQGPLCTGVAASLCTPAARPTHPAAAQYAQMSNCQQHWLAIGSTCQLWHQHSCVHMAPLVSHACPI
jgi:hypothetical protein